MTGRIFRSILAVAVAVLLLSFAVTVGVLYGRFSLVQREQLKTELAIAAHGAETGGLEWLTGLPAGGYRLTLVAPDGTVRFDTAADAAGMENHLDREEIAEALAAGSGESERASATLTERTLYQARRLADGDVLRISVTRKSVWALLLGMLPPLGAVLAAVLLLSAFLARRVARRAVAPLNALDLEHPLENVNYDELSPLLRRVARQQRQIESQLAELQEKRSELAAITGSMNEGLVLLDDRGGIVSINPAAQALFGADAASVGHDFLTVERGSEVRRTIETAMSEGRGEMVLSRGGRQYEIDASRIASGGRTAGVAILTFDITEKAVAEQQRREFTANVSHELKTPLQSIMGSAELMENGLVRPEDMPRFVGRIRSEAARLVTLIDDIIRLSQLDEHGELPTEEADLYAIAEEAFQALSEAAARRRVSLSLAGGWTPVRGVKRLLYEIVYNLADNAIRYNREGGSARIEVAESAGRAVLTVSDTGIGIPEAHQSRIFERFYRVDKSHSRETGGTGLGLSIVKHAVLAQHGEIHLESREGAGTRITVTLPG